MAESAYDQHAQFYVDYVDRVLSLEYGSVAMGLASLVACLGDRFVGARVCDLCCGEGYAGRHLLAKGAGEVVGVDTSSALIETAIRRAGPAGPSYRVDDACQLTSISDGAFDVVVCQMAMMDVADHRKLFAAVRRVLVTGGPFVFSMLHPCFEGPPFHVRDAPRYVVDDTGAPVAFAVRRYVTEGFWTSGGEGVRGRMGSYHRTLSTYVNDLIASGFVLERLAEPLAGGNAAQGGLFAEVPTVLVVAARAEDRPTSASTPDAGA